ncbi:hypothetical protein GE061_014017 [Apolygus lucorum]|uniref:Uncharacterized protein n=1 Tax=Apolygus lucorum TaxID=248454 RepID=A0A8S9XTH7_APOLU|nr:hypothetical protein GE061_014017 [Apolygus lucorum]
MIDDTINLTQIVELVHNKFTSFMGKDVSGWEMGETNREIEELKHVKGMIFNHEENCRRIYTLSTVMGLVALFFYTHSSPGILLGGLTGLLVTVLVLQLLTVRMRQRKALYYVDLVDDLNSSTSETEEMWPILFRVMRTYAPYITLPFAGLVGVIGYNMENLFSDKFTPYQKSISQQRKDRQEAEAGKNQDDDVSSLKERKFVARSVFEKNLSPSLQN